jgi:hypothetical protein
MATVLILFAGRAGDSTGSSAEDLPRFDLDALADATAGAVEGLVAADFTFRLEAHCCARAFASWIALFFLSAVTPSTADEVDVVETSTSSAERFLDAEFILFLDREELV